MKIQQKNGNKIVYFTIKNKFKKSNFTSNWLKCLNALITWTISGICRKFFFYSVQGSLCNFRRKFGADRSIFKLLAIFQSWLGKNHQYGVKRLSSVFFRKYHESSPLFGIWPPRLAASVVAHWGGNRTVPWPLVWDSWPLLYRTSLPRDHSENHLIWVDSIPVIPLAWSRMSLECLVGSHKFPTILIILSLQ